MSSRHFGSKRGLIRRSNLNSHVEIKDLDNLVDVEKNQGTRDAEAVYGTQKGGSPNNRRWNGMFM